MGIEPDKDVTVNWYTPDIENEGIFYTDSNGLELVKRKRRRSNENDLDFTTKAAINFYPINSAIFIEDVEDNT